MPQDTAHYVNGYLICPEGSYQAGINAQGNPERCVVLSTGQEVPRIPNRQGWQWQYADVLLELCVVWMLWAMIVLVFRKRED